MKSRRRFIKKYSLMFSGGLLGFPEVSFGTKFPIKSKNIKRNRIPIAEIIETKVICKQSGKYFGLLSEFETNEHGHPILKKGVLERDRYIGWPTITKTDLGEVMVVFSGDRDAHICPWGKTQIIKSQNQGKTWSKPITINNTPLDDRDAGIIQSKKGTLLISWFTSVAFESSYFNAAVQRYARHSEKLTNETREKWLGNWIRRSEDYGETWQEPIPTISSAPHGPVLLNDGRLLYIGKGKWKNQETITIEQSIDDGRTWKVISDLSGTDGYMNDLCEPHMVELPSGKILALFRCKNGYLMQTESYNKGLSWTPFHNTGIWGFPPHLICLKNNWLMVVYGHRKKPFGQRACISQDEGNTWDMKNEILLDNAPSPDLGYPSSIQLDDNSILTVYYQADKVGEPTVLKSTNWKLK